MKDTLIYAMCVVLISWHLLDKGANNWTKDDSFPFFPGVEYQWFIKINNQYIKYA